MDGGYAWAHQYKIAFIKTDLAIVTVKCLICQQQRPTQSPQYGTISWGNQPGIWWQVDHIHQLLSWKGRIIFISEIDTYSV